MADADAYYEDEKYEEAKNLYYEVTKIDSNYEDAYSGIIYSCIELAEASVEKAEEYEEDGDDEGALEAYEYAVICYDEARSTLIKVSKINGLDLSHFINKADGWITDIEGRIDSINGIYVLLYDCQDTFMTEDMKAAYRAIIRDLAPGIENYYWQYGITYGEYGYTANREAEPVSFVDVDCDGSLELFIMYSPNYVAPTGTGSARLEIYTYVGDGTAELMYAMEGFNAIEDEDSFYFFRNGYDGKLYALLECEDENGHSEYYKVLEEFDGVYQLSDVLYAEYNEEQNTYYHYDDIITKEEYDDEVYYMLSGNIQTVMYSELAENSNEDLVDISNCSSMSMGKVARALFTNFESGDGSLPIYEPIQLTFQSGVGAWWTEVTIYPDGRFEGEYIDYDMGTTGPKYPNGTVYTCEFEGEFTNISQKDDNVWELEIASIEYTEPGSEYIEDGVRYVNSEPYGLVGDKFEFYLPGTPVSVLPEEYISWVRIFRSFDTIPGFGLYNLQEESGFLSTL